MCGGGAPVCRTGLPGGRWARAARSSDGCRTQRRSNLDAPAPPPSVCPEIQSLRSRRTVCCSKPHTRTHTHAVLYTPETLPRLENAFNSPVELAWPWCVQNNQVVRDPIELWGENVTLESSASAGNFWKRASFTSASAACAWKLATRQGSAEWNLEPDWSKRSRLKGDAPRQPIRSIVRQRTRQL